MDRGIYHKYGASECGCVSVNQRPRRHCLRLPAYFMGDDAEISVVVQRIPRFSLFLRNPGHLLKKEEPWAVFP